jgi:hypothetical protein
LDGSELDDGKTLVDDVNGAFRGITVGMGVID